MGRIQRDRVNPERRRWQRLGGEILRTDVRKLLPDNHGGWRVETDQAVLHSKQIVVSAGVYSTELLKPLDIHIPLVSERGYRVEFADPGISLNHSVMDVEGKVVASSMADGLQVAGTSELARPDTPLNPKRTASLTRIARAMLPDLEVTNARE